MRRGLIVGVVGVVGIVVAVAVVLTVAIAGPTGTASAPEVDRGGSQRTREAPSVIIVVMDDMRTDDLPWMPTVRREIMRAGTRFTRFYAPTPLCCPSRASLLRGQYPHNTGILTNAEPDGGFAGFSALEDSTLATWLDKTHTTGYVGKYMNGYDGDTQTHVPKGWDFWNGTTQTYNYQKVFINENGTIVDHSGPNSPRVLGRRASHFVNQNAPEHKPFFLHLSLVTPHKGWPHTDNDHGWTSPWVPPRDRGTYTGPAHPQGPAYNEQNVSDKTGPVATMPPLTRKHKRQAVLRTQQRRESLASADRAVQQVLETLDAYRQRSNTFVLFTSDNGQLLGEHRFATSKEQPYEPSARVPLLIAGPGVPAGNSWAAPAGMQDLAPTVLEMAGVSVDGVDVELDGRSVLPTVERPEGDLSRAVLVEQADLPNGRNAAGEVRHAPRQTVRETDWVYHAAVTRRWKLIEWDQLETYELYNLRTDPDEVHNLAYRPGYQGRLKTMVERLEQLRWCTGADCG